MGRRMRAQSIDMSAQLFQSPQSWASPVAVVVNIVIVNNITIIINYHCHWPLVLLVPRYGGTNNFACQNDQFWPKLGIKVIFGPPYPLSRKSFCQKKNLWGRAHYVRNRRFLAKDTCFFSEIFLQLNWGYPPPQKNLMENHCAKKRPAELEVPAPLTSSSYDWSSYIIHHHHDKIIFEKNTADKFFNIDYCNSWHI